IRTYGDKNVLFEGAEKMRSLAAESPPGLTTKLTGQMGYFDDSVRILEEIDGKLLAGTIALISLLLLLIYRSPFLWLLPLSGVAVAELTARGLGSQLSDAGTTVTSQGAALMTVLIFGVGTDYALLVIARYREELRRHEDRHEAMQNALRRSGPSIFASGVTVILALLCLSFANVNATSGAGPIGAMGVALAMFAMLTLLPTLLIIVGREAFWPFIPSYRSAETFAASKFWSRLATRIAARPRLVSLAVVGLMGLMALGWTAHSGGLDLEKSFRGDVESVEGQQLLERTLPPGATGPLTVLVADKGALGPVRRALRSSRDIAGVGLQQQSKGVTRIEAALRYPPYSDTAIAAVPRIRAALDKAAPGKAYVAGASAVEADSRKFAARDNRLIMPLALLVVALVLVVLLRSLLAPLLLIATVVVSFLAVLGASYVVFEHLFGFPGVDEYLPLFVFIFLVALGVDYNIFLMARVREEARRFGTREGMRRGLVATGGVITSAGIVLAGTFLVLASMPSTTLTEVGFAVALGVLFDALIVRSVLVPALAFALGDRIWWPARMPEQPAGGGAGPTNGHITAEATPAIDDTGFSLRSAGKLRDSVAELPDWTGRLR
ncbi:MAG TPA: MMPL family transporter, partial [Solirubrobacterales bacterium]|nr:MMPL family transporter [Solirubrobacterales bacterium]